MLLRFDTGPTLDKLEAQRLYRRIYEWSAGERWWCGAPHVMIEHAGMSRLHGTLEATFDDEPIDLAMGHRDAVQFFAFLATTGVDWQIVVEGPRSSAIVPDPDAVFAANPTRYGDQIGGSTSRGLGAKTHYRRWLLATIALVEEPRRLFPRAPRASCASGIGAGRPHSLSRRSTSQIARASRSASRPSAPAGAGAIARPSPSSCAGCSPRNRCTKRR